MAARRHSRFYGRLRRPRRLGARAMGLPWACNACRRETPLVPPRRSSHGTGRFFEAPRARRKTAGSKRPWSAPNNRTARPRQNRAAGPPAIFRRPSGRRTGHAGFGSLPTLSWSLVIFARRSARYDRDFLEAALPLETPYLAFNLTDQPEPSEG